mmetsp:Transcript_10161/g.29629  ORF Transcript_10161/g.29629 Transcript_10161/m.29629 type:complete len:215 (-) Transcript_10161:1296-1940(-)
MPGPPQQPAGRTPGPTPPVGSQSGCMPPSSDWSASINAAGPPHPPKPLPSPLACQGALSPPMQPPLPRPPAPLTRPPFPGCAIGTSLPPPFAACSARLSAAAVGADGSTLIARPLTRRPCKASMANCDLLGSVKLTNAKPLGWPVSSMGTFKVRICKPTDEKSERNNSSLAMSASLPMNSSQRCPGPRPTAPGEQPPIPLGIMERPCGPGIKGC